MTATKSEEGGHPIGAARRAIADALRSYLPSQRWFGAKGRALESVEVEDVVPVPGLDRAAIVIAIARFTDGVTRFQIPLVADAADAPVDTRAAIAPGITDASKDESFRSALLSALSAAVVSKGQAWSWRTDPLPDGIAVLRDLKGAPSKVGTAEQSNTSITYGTRAIAKIFRRLEAGQNPDPEIATALTRAGFRHVPAVLARAVLEMPGGESADSVLVQSLIPDARDEWSHALERGRPYFTAAAESEPKNPYAADARALGEVTRGMHDALAGITAPDFGSRQATAADVERWRASAERSMDRAMRLLEAAIGRGALPHDRMNEAKALAKRGNAFREQIARAATAAAGDPGVLIRHHGDYHLGQLLRGGDGSLHIIDFEGEPARPLAERRAPNSPLRDVAGMLRSFGYAASTLLSMHGGALPLGVREQRAARWEREAQQAFLEGYRIGDSGLVLPRTPEGTDAVRSLFELEKAFYELSYEIDNRPDWAWIPMRALSKMLTWTRGDEDRRRAPRPGKRERN